jgi:hypothetical protein
LKTNFFLQLTAVSWSIVNCLYWAKILFSTWNSFLGILFFH